jgi:hypothetical protein
MAGKFPTARRASRAARVATVLLGAGLLSGLASPAWSDEEAMQLLKKTSDYMARQQTISIKFDSDIEIVTPSLQKIQFASSGEALLNRPDKLRLSRQGGYSDVELVFDGAVVTLHGKNANAYVQTPFTGSIDGLVDKLRAEFAVDAPGADLLLADMFKQMSADVLDGKHIGQGVVDGVECEHLAFRGPEVDWQIWVESGSNPAPRKYVITSKMVAGAPQYTLRIKEWKAGLAAQPDAFAFRPGDAKRVEMKEAAGWDEVPPAVSEGTAR